MEYENFSQTSFQKKDCVELLPTSKIRQIPSNEQPEKADLASLKRRKWFATTFHRQNIRLRQSGVPD